ncbi:succinyldiaminopimelate transaminase [Bordetella flabilis]|uniref:Succinyldiaminopimelate transaminase n=1 Tax=Bordetella flabilis TaxID=463014 RepID=A0A193GCT9_9BORD|nr:succinyldiaminopimelate transaminase [Bordetella flabilis]ANN77837.1 succinyldiaminopimelate transaminase [Bordetella flabilis]
MTSARNPYIDRLGPYPMVRMARLLSDINPPADKPLIRFSIGEPKHALPQVLVDALAGAAGKVNAYPPSRGSDAMHRSIANWVERRFAPARVDPRSEVLPVNGAREGLFSFAEAVLDKTRADSLVICPNPGYAVYDGVTKLSGLTPRYFATHGDGPVGERYAAIPAEIWRRTQMIFVCTPDNPRGDTLALDDWRTLFRLSDEHGFIIAADECYSEIYVNGVAPLGALQAAAQLGRAGYERLVAFFSLSKRSNATGLRSGFIAGDAALLQQTEQFRSYNGGGMNQAVEAASIAAWDDEAHVQANRERYRRKFEKVIPLLQSVLPVQEPRAGFFLWVDVRHTGMSDEAFARALMAEEHVQVLPGTYLTHECEGVDPGIGYVRLALVADEGECMEGARRIVRFCENRKSRAQAA